MGMNFSGNQSNRYAVKYKPASQRYISQNMSAGTTLTTFSPAANRIYVGPWVAQTTVTIDQAGINVTTGSASSHGKIVIYDSDGDGRPRNLLYESTSLDTSAIAVVTDSASLTLYEGQQYWIGVRFDGTPVISGDQPYTRFSLGRGASISTSNYNLLGKALSFATSAPISWTFDPTEEVSSAGTPVVFLRVM